MQQYRWLPPLCLALVVFTWAGAASALINLTSPGGYLFDIYDDARGYVSNGTSDAYDGCYTLRINGTDYNAGTAGTLTGRTVQMATITMSPSLNVTRQAYVPDTVGDYIRYYDVIENTGGATTITVAYYCNFGSDSSTTTWGTHSGDTTVDLADFWFGTDDADGSGDPSLAHAYFGDGAIWPVTSYSVPTGSSTVEYSVSLGAGETVAFLVFGFQGPNRAAVRTQVEDLVFDVASATDDMDGGDLSLVVNWGLGGAPLIRWAPDQLFEIYEGGELELNVTIEDREGDPTTTSWDLDNDGVYDDADGETATASAVGLDGPSTMTIGVMSSDDEDNVSERRIELDVLNAPPVFLSTPETTDVLIREEWTYLPIVEDPGGDEVTIEVLDRPAGMVLLPEGGVRWEPSDEDVGEHVLYFVATDADDDPEIEGDGDATQEVVITVSENNPPSAPTIEWPPRGEEIAELRPTLVVNNPADPEGDALFITFEVDVTDTFPSPTPSGPQPAGADGTTAWTVTQDLEDNQRYFWRACASDGYNEGPCVSSYFSIDMRNADGGPGDGGPDDGGPDEDGGPDDHDGVTVSSGCSATASRQATGTAGLVLLALIALGLRPRR